MIDSRRSADDAGFTGRFDDLRVACTHGSPQAAFEKLRSLHADADRFIDAQKRDLFRAPLALNDAQKANARGVAQLHRRLADTAGRVADALARDPGADGRQLAHATALALHHLGETLKCEMAEKPREPRHFAGMHALMRRAIDGGWQRAEVLLQAQSVDARCTVEFLYLRALLVARSGGALSTQQVEILDAWLWMWMPAIHAGVQVPGRPWLRVDMDSAKGLSRSADPDGGFTLYLPLLPLERAFRTLLQGFQGGEIAPAEGHASRFRIEEHMVVLDLVRRTLRDIRREAVSRAPRSASAGMAQLHVGITEIMTRGFGVAAPASVVAQLVARDGDRPEAPRREGDDALASVYELARRDVRVLDVSASGVGLEGDARQCRDICVGDVVALRLSPDAPLELGKVARRVRAPRDGRVTLGVQRAPAANDGRLVIGVRQLSPAVRRLAAIAVGGNPGRRAEQVLFVPGADSSGRQDALLVAESSPIQGQMFDAEVDGTVFTLRLNRVRDRGRGWILAGFEITAARKRLPVDAAA
jgi:hypothetical protein